MQRSGKAAAEGKKTQNGALVSLDDQELALLLALLLLLRNDTSSSKRVLPRKRHVKEAVDVLVLVVDVCHERGCSFFCLFCGGGRG